MCQKEPSLLAPLDVIYGHHLWYDDSHGYTSDFRTAESPYKTIIDIVMTADCMDAATDRVGRSYQCGKSLEDFAKEVEEGAGTRYAPYLAELLKDPDTRADIEFLLNEGRKHLYRETFRLLCDLLRKGQTNAE